MPIIVQRPLTKRTICLNLAQHNKLPNQLLFSSKVSKHNQIIRHNHCPTAKHHKKWPDIRLKSNKVSYFDTVLSALTEVVVRLTVWDVRSRTKRLPAFWRKIDQDQESQRNRKQNPPNIETVNQRPSNIENWKSKPIYFCSICCLLLLL